MKLFDLIAEFSSKGVEKVNKEVDKIGEGAEKASSKLEGISKGMDNFGNKMTKISAPLIAGFTALTAGTKELRNELAVLETNASRMGVSSNKAHDYLIELGTVSDDTGANIEALSNLLESGLDESQMTVAMENIMGAAIKFKDTLKMEGISDGLQETLATGKSVGPFAELLERSGIVLEDFDKQLQSLPTHADRVNFALETMSSRGLSKVTDDFRKLHPELVKENQEMNKLKIEMAETGKVLVPVMTLMISKVGDLFSWFNNLDDSQKKIILSILGIIVVIGPLAKVTSGAINVFGGLGKAFAFIAANPTVLIIGALLAIGVGLTALLSQSDTFKLHFEQNFNNLAIVFEDFILNMNKGLRDFLGKIPEELTYGMGLLGTGIRKLQGQFQRTDEDLFKSLQNRSQRSKEIAKELDAVYEKYGTKIYDEDGNYLYTKKNSYIETLIAEAKDDVNKLKELFTMAGTSQEDIDDIINGIETPDWDSIYGGAVEALADVNGEKEKSNKLDREAIELAKKMKFSRTIEIERDLSVGKFAHQNYTRQTDMANDNNKVIAELKEQNRLMMELIGVTEEKTSEKSYISLNSDSISKDIKRGVKRSSTIAHEAGVM